MKKNKIFLLMALLLSFLIAGKAQVATAADEGGFKADYPKRQKWSWTGPLGHYDRAAAQRGLQVYTQVCAGCHALSRLPFRSLSKIGYSPEEIKAFARTYQINIVDDQGQSIQRSGLPSDFFPDPFVSEADARVANGGALPPDLSLIVKARNHGRHNVFVNFFDAVTIQGDASGADYVHALLVGYVDPPSNIAISPGMYFNKYFSGGQIAMASPLVAGAVSYSDGTPNDVEQMSHDVVTFLAFVSEPNLEASRYLALKFFIVLFVIYYLVYRMKKNKWRELDDQ